MRYRQLGRTDLRVSEIGFGAWGIGGESYGTVSKREALAALNVAEEHGCNFVDTAAVYGESEAILGEFLSARRDRWLIATKYSGQPAGLENTLNEQLQRLRTDRVDLYQLHWMPRGKDAVLLDQLEAVKRSGKARYIGISLYSLKDIDDVLARGTIDAIQLAFNLLEPMPLLARIEVLRARSMGVVVRSALKEGFLTGRFSSRTTFDDPRDERSKLGAARLHELVAQAEHFRFLEATHGSMRVAATLYPLAFDVTSTVLLGTKSAQHAEENFSESFARLTATELARIETEQRRLGVIPSPLAKLRGIAKRVWGRI